MRQKWDNGEKERWEVRFLHWPRARSVHWFLTLQLCGLFALKTLVASQGCRNEAQHSGGLEWQKFILLQARHLISRCWQGHTPSKASGGLSFLALSTASEPSCSLASSRMTPFSASGFPWLSSVSVTLSLHTVVFFSWGNQSRQMTTTSS